MVKSDWLITATPPTPIMGYPDCAAWLGGSRHQCLVGNGAGSWIAGILSDRIGASRTIIIGCFFWVSAGR